ncbi:hypothetical protein HOLleu_31217 [Holothuria leucospilota]|uniref:BEN domain-containing protein n=1 Tax=Holothuria leucospilota TaxID=206669 RepID=A0A9Q0YRM4_HOLLE|nr:hypothetical protein HOLleu_31217 [Holothuria leucospilota]
METNGDAGMVENATPEENQVEKEEGDSEALEIKEEPQAEEMKDYAEDTMNELLGIYGYDGVDKSMTENLQLHHFAPEDGTSPGPVGQTVEEGVAGVTVHKAADETSPNKQAATPAEALQQQKLKAVYEFSDKVISGVRRRSSSSSGYHLRELKVSPATAAKSRGSYLVNGGDKSLMNQYKASKPGNRKRHLQAQNSNKQPTVIKKRKVESESDSEGSMCSCGTCDLDHGDGHNPQSHRQVDIIKEIQKLLEENKSLRRENKKLKAELRESLNVKQLSRDLRHLTSQLQGNSSLGTPLPRPPSTGSASSVTGLKVNGSTKKPLGVKQQKLEDPGEGNQEGEEDEDLEHAEELWPDSGILLPASRILTALQNAQQNYRLFTRSLMEMVFTKETMAASSARGQKAMGKNAMENPNPRPPLDQNAVQAIVSRVCSEFPDIHQTLVMGVIRQKIADVRKRLKIQSIRELAQQCDSGV